MPLSYLTSRIFSQILEQNKECILKGLEKKTISKGEPLCNGIEDVNTHTFLVASGEVKLYFDDTDVSYIHFTIR